MQYRSLWVSGVRIRSLVLFLWYDLKLWIECPSLVGSLAATQQLSRGRVKFHGMEKFTMSCDISHFILGKTKQNIFADDRGFVYFVYDRVSQSLVVSQTSNSTVHVKWRRNKIFKIIIGQYDEHQVHCFAAGGRKRSGLVGIFYYPGSNIFCVVGNREKFKGSSWLLTMSSIFHPCFR